MVRVRVRLELTLTLTLTRTLAKVAGWSHFRTAVLPRVAAMGYTAR